MAANRFKREQKHYQLNFEGTDLDGAEIVMKGVSLGRFLEVSRLASLLATPEGRTPENVEAQFQVLAGLLVSWNWDDEDDQPIPATYDGLKTLDFADVQQIMQGYMQAIASVPKASSSDSTSGGRSQEESLGLASLSAVQAS